MFLADIMQTLEIFWKGMLAIFVAIGVIYICILIMNAFTKHNEKKNNESKSK